MNLPAQRADLAPVSPADDSRVVGFAYETLSADDARELQTVTARMRERMQANMIEDGRDLIRVKERLAGTVGAFGAWLQGEFGMSERTAQNYMSAARVFGDHAAVVAVLPPGTVYKLAAPSTPETVRADVVRQIEEGKRPEPAAILETIVMAKRAESERRETERKAKVQSNRRGRQGKLSPEAQVEWDRKQANKDKANKRQDAKNQVRIQRIEAAADEIAGLIAERLGDDLAGVMASSEEHGVWHSVRDRLKAISAQLNAPETAVRLDAA